MASARVASAANRGLDDGHSQPPGVADREVLGGFKWSSQHLQNGEQLRWMRRGSDAWCQRRVKMSHSWRMKMSHPVGESAVSRRAR